MRTILSFVLFVASCSVAFGVPEETGFDDNGQPLYLLQDITDGAGTLIYNGTRSVAGEFPAMGWIGNCTGTAVAPDVIFTAAHCVRTGSRITFSHRGTGRGYSATCTRHPRVNTRNWYNDYAFCKLDNALPEGSVLASFKMENPSTGEDLLLNGLGAPNVRVHYWGRAPVRRISGQDIVTCGPANLGGGDSGGALLEWTDDRTGASGFYVYGVNSRGGGGCSYYNRASHTEFASFARSYESSQGVQICGVSRSCVAGDDDDDGDDDDGEQPDCVAKFQAVKAALADLRQCVR